MKSQTKQLLFTVAAVIFGFAGIFALSNFLEKNRQPLPKGYEDSDNKNEEGQ